MFLSTYYLRYLPTYFSIWPTFQVLYLRQFGKLKSLNLSGNPLCHDQKFLQFICAYLPNLVYYEYCMIQDDQRREARIFFG